MSEGSYKLSEDISHLSQGPLLLYEIYSAVSVCMEKHVNKKVNLKKNRRTKGFLNNSFVVLYTVVYSIHKSDTFSIITCIYFIFCCIMRFIVMLPMNLL